MTIIAKSSLEGKEMTLKIKGIGNVPSMKNGKMILWKQKRTMTDPKKQLWMEKAIKSIQYQLSLTSPTIVGGTWMACVPQYSTYSFIPRDDSWQVVPQISLSVKKVKKGEEGCILTIKKI